MTETETAHTAAEDIQGLNLWPNSNSSYSVYPTTPTPRASSETPPRLTHFHADMARHSLNVLYQTWFCAAPCRLVSACARRDSQRCCRPLGSWTSARPSRSWRSPQRGTRKGMWRPVVPLTPPWPPPSCPDALGGPGTCSPTDQVGNSFSSQGTKWKDTRDTLGRKE